MNYKTLTENIVTMAINDLTYISTPKDLILIDNTKWSTLSMKKASRIS